MKRSIAVVIGVGLGLGCSGAGEHRARAQDGAFEPPAQPLEFTSHPDEPAVSYHSVTIGGERIWYEARAGTITMVSDEQTPAAKMFYMSYRKVLTDPERRRAAVERGGDVESLYPDAGERPITFSFNGGPGSSSVWLHLGLFGPRRVDYADDFGNPGAAPWEVVPNDMSLLDKSDFVFIDPVSTGYSRAVGEGDAKEFHGLEGDAESVAEFIRRFIVMEDRWRSPKFIAGESYGTTRAAALSRELWSSHGIGLNGIVLVSAILNFQTARFTIGNDLPYPLFLPTFTAIAHFHGKLGDRLQEMNPGKATDEAIEFAMGDYLHALAQGDRLNDEEEQRVARRLGELTGLSVGFILDSNLRVGMPAFPKELLRDQGRTVGRLDGRFKGFDRDDAGDGNEYDPSMAAIRGIYTGSLNAYIREELGYHSDLPYEILTGNVRPWVYGSEGENQFINVSERLRQAMHQQPQLKVFLASGLYDLATPFWAADYTIDHMQLDDSLRSNIETHYYEAGHMMYIHRPSLERLKADLEGFYDRALEQ